MTYFSTTRRLAAMAAACALFPGLVSAQEEEPVSDDTAYEEMTDEEIAAAYAEWTADFDANLEKRTGDISILDGQVILHVSEDWYYLDTADGRAVLEDGWGNPPDPELEGMLFPARYLTQQEGGWGVIIYWTADGYVSDKDAEKINYTKLMREMQRDTEAANEYRVAEGYGTVELIGWAEPPVYDAQTNRMYWAKDLVFDGSDYHTLNYDMRVLGRRGVLTLSYVAGMDQLEEIRASRDEVLAMAEFTDGNRYADYQPGDQKAEYGLAALVAGGAGLAIAKKTGIIAMVLLALKKFWFIIAGVVIAGFTRLKGLFSKE